jgi:lipid II:glycine glycyltransferase (peptidoglycan interpeptide bridge formation enzyme)
VLSELGRTVRCEDFDAFPYFLDYPVQSPDYIVRQCESDEETLASFDREVRRKLRRAAEMGYELRSDDSPEALKKAWPLYQDCARRKHFRLERPLSVYMGAMRLAGAHNCARLYTASLNGEMVGSTLVFRDRRTAHSMLAAFHAEHRHAAVLLHWHAMRDMYRRGAGRYNMGPGPGSLARFKQQFCEYPTAYPAAVTAVFNEPLYKLWTAIFPVAKGLRPLLRRIVSRVKQ